MRKHLLEFNWLFSPPLVPASRSRSAEGPPPSPILLSGGNVEQWNPQNGPGLVLSAVTRRPHWNPIFFPAELTAHVRKLPAWSRWWAEEQKHFSPFFLHTRWQTQTGHYSFIYSKHAIMCQLMSESGNRQETRLQIHHTLFTCFNFPQAITLMNSYVRWSLLVHKTFPALHGKTALQHSPKQRK